MIANFPKSIKLILKHEGGYVDHPKDPGGATNLGITRKTLAAYRNLHWQNLSKRQVRNLTLDEAKAIYKKNYWDRCLCDDLPKGIDYAVMDYAVNSGVSRSVKLLQRIVGAKVDGVAGLGTLRKVSEYENKQKLLMILCDNRLSFMKALRTWSVFGKGWKRRVDRVSKDAGLMLDTFEDVDIQAADRVDLDVKHALSIKEIAISLGVWG